MDRKKTSRRLIAMLSVTGCLGLGLYMALPMVLQSPPAPPSDVLHQVANDKPANKLANKPGGNVVDKDTEISFNRDIRPILSDKCFACHGPDAAVAVGAGGFRLDVFEEAIKPAASGDRPIVPGNADASEVLKRIAHTNPKLVMPPPRSKVTVTADEAELLRRWINEGAKYQGHWAYESPTKPALPALSDASEKWARNNIDRFIAARLEKEGLSPSKEADATTLIRRVTLDLTGLPPTPEQIDAFVADPSPDAYEKLVDRLLASPHFGERMAILWLDAARYGDTNGYHHDNIRTAWPWRQWVIEAYNNNLPYDQFVVQQLAGDLLPNATQQQILASGFCRMHNINDEGGALNEEYIVEAVADRIETVATVFMAQTFNCARCHDHKYDPIPQSDYYSLWAYFNSVDQERGVYGQNFQAARAYPPFMLWKTDELKAKLNELEPQLAQAREINAKNKPELDKQLAEWQANLRTQTGIKWVTSKLTGATSSHKGTKVEIKPDRSALLSGKDVPAKEDITLTLTTDATGLRVIKLDALPVKVRNNLLLGRDKNGNAVLTHVSVKATSVKDPNLSQQVTLVAAWANHTQADGNFDIKNTLRDDAEGWAVDGHNNKTPRTAMFIAENPFGYEGGTEVQITLRHQSQYAEHTLANVRVDLASTNDQAIKLLAGEGEPTHKPVAGIDRELLPDPIHDQYISSWRKVYAPDIDKHAEQLAELEGRYKKLEDEAVPVLIMKEADNPVPAYILERGSYDKPVKDKVIERQTPSMVKMPMPEGAPNNRLGFAMWLTQPQHPLTSRVYVNRLWYALFGTGIVKTIEDFGSQSDWPSHLELLDYLAVQFVESGWDQKALIKQIVTSATYRQSAKRNMAAEDVDSDNRLLSHFPRQRLKGEFIRDQALFVAGLLDGQIGGASVKPYQPGDLWNEVAMSGSNTMSFKRGGVDELYRRSMYTFWKRTSPPPQMQIFNAPTREFCIVSRDTTNTPLQVLTIWNDEQFLEAARVLAQRTLSEAADDDKRLELIFRRCTGNIPNTEESAVLKEVLSYYRQRYAASVDDATALLKQGEYPLPQSHDPAELASWMMVASTALSLDETIVRD